VVAKILGVRELKGFIGIIYAINSVGAILPGISMDFILSFLGFQNSLRFSALICLVMGFIAIQTGRSLNKGEEPIKTAGQMKWLNTSIFHSRLLFLTCNFIFFAALIRIFLDYTFAETTTFIFADGHELTVFLGLFNSALRFAQLLSQFLFSRHLLKKLSPSLLIGLAPFTAIIMSVSALSINQPFLIVGFQFLLMYLMNIAVYPSFDLLLGIAPEEEKARFRFFGEGILSCFSNMLAGGLILGFQFLQLPANNLFMLSFFIAIIWLFRLLSLRKTYVETLEELVVSGEIRGGKKVVPNTHACSVQMHSFFEKDSSAEDNSLRFSLLPKNKESLTELLEKLHSNGEFRNFAALVDDCAGNRRENYSELLSAYVFSVNNRVRSTVIPYLLKFSRDEHVISSALDSLREMILSENNNFRSSAAALIGELGLDCFLPQLINLLRDREAAVRKSALIASFKYPQPELLTILEEMNNSEENEFQKDLLQRAIKERQERICQEVEQILLRFEFADKQRLLGALRSIKKSRHIKTALRILELKPFRLSLCLVELFSAHENREKLNVFFEDFLAGQAQEFSLLVADIIRQREADLVEIAKSIIKMEKEQFAGALADAIASLPPSEKCCEGVFCFIFSLLIFYGLDAGAAESISRLFSEGGEKGRDFAVELLESGLDSPILRKNIALYCDEIFSFR
jgi:hypothetical protein